MASQVETCSSWPDSVCRDCYDAILAPKLVAAEKAMGLLSKVDRQPRPLCNDTILHKPDCDCMGEEIDAFMVYDGPAWDAAEEGKP